MSDISARFNHIVHVLVVSMFLSTLSAFAIELPIGLDSIRGVQAKSIKSLIIDSSLIKRDNEVKPAIDARDQDVTLTPSQYIKTQNEQRSPATSTTTTTSTTTIPTRTEDLNQISATERDKGDEQADVHSTKWIESILSQVEASSIRGNNQETSTKATVRNLSQRGILEESDVSTTTSNYSPSIATTIYSIGSVDKPSLMAPNIDEEEQRLLESNNVSDIIDNFELHSNSRLQPIPRLQLSCSEAFERCNLRDACRPAYEAYRIECNDLINNKTNECSPKCIKALISLRSWEDSDDLINCDCEDDDFCLMSKQKVQLCKPQVDKALDKNTIVSCSTARSICAAATGCSSALDHYYEKCRSLLTSHYCSRSCNNSLTILYTRSEAKKLINCYCDGTEDFECVKYKSYTETYCLNKWKTLYDPNSSATATDQDEISNLTHDIEDIDQHHYLNDNRNMDENSEDTEINDGADIASSGYNLIFPLESYGTPSVNSNYISDERHRHFIGPPSKMTSSTNQVKAKRIQKNLRQPRTKSAQGARNYHNNLGRPSSLHRSSSVSSILLYQDSSFRVIFPIISCLATIYLFTNHQPSF